MNTGRTSGERAESHADLERLLTALPAAIYTTDAEGYVTFYNEAAEALAGRRPEIGRDRWCVSWRLWRPDGSELPHDSCPMAQALKTGEAVRGVELVAERPNGERVRVMPFPSPLRDDAGRLIGAVNMLVDMGPLKSAEAAAGRRASQQAALFRFTDRLYRADAIDDVYEAALDAITSALNCRRASILLFDDFGVMRFVASRGLSEGYQRAVDGHSPWTLGTIDPQPICIEEAATDASLGAAKHAIAAEGIRALTFIPIVEQGAVIGKFMAYYDNPHAFGAEEIEIAVTIGRQLGFAVERSRAKERFGLVFDRAGVGMVLMREDCSIVRANPAFAIIVDRPIDDVIGARCTDFTHKDDVNANAAAVDALRLSGGPVTFEKRYIRTSGEVVWARVTLSLVADRQILAVVEDVTGPVQAQRQRLLLIHELNHRVKNTLATVQSLADQTLRNTVRSDDARALFNSRLAALSRAHDLLTRRSWESAGMREMVEAALAPFMPLGRVRLNGVDFEITPKQSLAFAIALHELATNASKYGSLSNEGGAVEVSWAKHGNAISLNWTERGGPPVAEPERNGFGLRLLRRNLAHDLGGETRVDFAPSGVVAHITSAAQAQVGETV
ncbi:chemotaxis protein methyltransferase CheR [alpha proteobacterium U9-1i]|nr:chemotaxis protein methyltransferase CheR [alpha proteobacterium U9-1i]